MVCIIGVERNSVAMGLQTETNTPAMERRVLRAARVLLGHRRWAADFEHGQWWLTNLDTGAQWSVVDAEGAHTHDGFAFEQVTRGEED